LREFDAETSSYLRDKLFGDKLEKRAKWEKLFDDPVFTPKYIMPLDDLRSIAYKRIKRVCDEKIVSIFDFETDPKNIFTAHEMLGQLGGDLATKFTV
jgi:acyl-CoA oxidase